MGAGHCQWGGFTDQMYVIIPLGPSAAAGEAKTHGRKARKYIRMRDFRFRFSLQQSAFVGVDTTSWDPTGAEISANRS